MGDADAMGLPSRPRLLLVLAVAVAGAAALALPAWWVWPRTAINTANAARIQRGMTPAEVEAILGGPARDESTRRTPRRGPSGLIGLPGWDQRQWHSDEVRVLVAFDLTGTAGYVSVSPPRTPPEDIPTMIRRWLGR